MSDHSLHALEHFLIPIPTRMCDDVIERVLRVMSVMIVSGVCPSDPQCDDLSFGAGTNLQVVQRQTSTLGKLHNHPSGDPKPSQADIAITAEIVAAGAAIGVKVHDHLVIARNGTASFKALGLL